jgi:hypothetical protein
MLAVGVGHTRAWNAQPLRPLGESAEMLDLMVVEEDGAAYFLLAHGRSLYRQFVPIQ